jgi:hypothetical protein
MAVLVAVPQYGSSCSSSAISKHHLIISNAALKNIVGGHFHYSLGLFTVTWLHQVLDIFEGFLSHIFLFDLLDCNSLYKYFVKVCRNFGGKLSPHFRGLKSKVTRELAVRIRWDYAEVLGVRISHLIWHGTFLCKWCPKAPTTVTTPVIVEG